MTKCDGKTEQGKRQFLPPVIADTAMQIEHIVTTSLGASSQIDFILCSNNPILKFYSPLAGGEWSWTRLGNSVWRMLGFADWLMDHWPSSLSVRARSALDINNQFNTNSLSGLAEYQQTRSAFKLLSVYFVSRQSALVQLKFGGAMNCT